MNKHLICNNTIWQSCDWSDHDYAQCFVLGQCLKSNKQITLTQYKEYTEEYMQLTHKHQRKCQTETFQYLTHTLNESDRKDLQISDKLWNKWQRMAGVLIFGM